MVQFTSNQLSPVTFVHRVTAENEQPSLLQLNRNPPIEFRFVGRKQVQALR